MGKTTAPLLSFDARGSIAKTLTFSKWKGKAYARQHVTPANPNTTAQQTQRGFIRDITKNWADVLSVPRTGWENQAALFQDPMSGFNAYTKSLVPLMKASGDKDTEISESQTENTDSIDITATMQDISSRGSPSLADSYELRWGTKARQLDNSVACTVTAPDLTASIPENKAETTYYYQIVNTTQSTAVTGVNEYTTSA